MSKLRAKKAFMVSPRRFVGAGDLLDDKDPIVKGRERLFESIDEPKAPSKVTRKAVKAAKKKAAPAADDG